MEYHLFMHYHIILTEICNLKCTYCYGKSMEEFENGLEEKWDYDPDTPERSEVSVERLKKFLKPTDTLIFYGGEPLIEIDKIKEIMDNVDCKFQIQTNGLLLDKLPLDYLLRLDKMLVSIDGSKERDCLNKGCFHYDKVISNLKEIRAKGYCGEIVARMVVSEKSDIYEQVMHIVGLIKEGLFSSIHWQIDAEFYKFDYDKEKFGGFVVEYNKSLKKLISWWFSEIEGGRIWKIYPFLGVLGRVMGWDKETRLPCGAGYANFAINTKGDLSACPIMNSVKNLYCGSVDKGIVSEMNCGGWCKGCDYLDICGGRCLYSNNAQLWPKEGHEQVCETVKCLIDEIKLRKNDVNRLIEKGKVEKEDFMFEKYFGPEIIP